MATVMMIRIINYRWNSLSPLNKFCRKLFQKKNLNSNSSLLDHSSKRFFIDNNATLTIFEIIAGGSSSYLKLNYRDLFEYAYKIIEKSEIFDSEVSSNSQQNPKYGAQNSAAVNLRMKDLRWLQPTSSAPLILVRRHAIIVSLDFIKAIVFSDKVLLIVSAFNDPLLQMFEENMKEWTSEVLVDGSRCSVPFELYAYDALLITAKSAHSKQLTELNIQVQQVLQCIEGSSGAIMSSTMQEDMRRLKNNVSQLAMKVTMYSQLLNDLMDNDDDLALMSLTVLQSQPQLYQLPLSENILSQHEEVEELLQAYFTEYNSMVSKLEHLKNQIQNAEDLVSIRLDTSRNELLVVNTSLSLMACTFGLGAYITSIFGMNLDNIQYFENTPGMFAAVVSSCSLAMGSLFLIVFRYLEFKNIFPKRMRPWKKLE